MTKAQKKIESLAISRNCRNCGELLPADRPKLIFCDNGNKCKMTWSRKSRAPRKTRQQQRLDSFRESAFLLWLVQQTRRSGTVEVITGDLAALLDVFNLRRRVDGYNQGEPLQAFHMAHIHPIEHKERLGCLHEQNLFIAPAKANRQHGQKFYGYGVSLPVAKLNPKLSVTNSTPQSEVVDLIFKCYGKARINAFLRIKGITKKLRKAWVYKVDRYLTKLGVAFDHLPNKERRELAVANGFSESTYSADAWSDFTVLRLELERFATLPCTWERREELTQAALLLTRIEPRFKQFDRDHDGSVYPVDQDDERLCIELLGDIYDVLQGKYLLECSSNIWWHYEGVRNREEQDRATKRQKAITAKANATRARNRLAQANAVK